jgi:hypothetical protein
MPPWPAALELEIIPSSTSLHHYDDDGDAVMAPGSSAAAEQDISPFPPTPPHRDQPPSPALGVNDKTSVVASGSNQDSPFPQYTSLDIPYSSPTIFTSPEIQSINCFVYVPLRILVCYVCQIAISPSRLIRHRRDLPHLDRGVTQDFVNRLTQSQNLFRRDYFEPAEAPKVLVPGIQWSIGLQCTMHGCTHSTTSRSRMGRHIRADHESTIRQFEPSVTSIQTLFESHSRRYTVDVPVLENPSSPRGVSSPFALLLNQYKATLTPSPFAIPDDPAVLNPVLAKYHWMEILQGRFPKDIKNLISLPACGEKLEALICPINDYYQKISEEMRRLDIHTTTLRWINSTKE